MDAAGDNRMLPWVFFRLVLLYFSCPATLNIAAGQELCRVPTFPPPNSNDRGSGAISSLVQVIIPTMKFSGCGVIQTWTVYGRGTGGIGPGLQLQVFQPNPTRASVYTKVASTSVITAGTNLKSHIFGQLDLTFSPGNVLGFFYHNTDAFVEVHHTNSFSTHYILTSNNAQLSPTVTVAANRVSLVPRISVAVMCSACTPGEGNGPTTTSTTTTATTTTTTATTMTSAAVTTSTTVTTATSTVPTIGSPESTSPASVSPTPSSILIEPAGASTERPSSNEGLVAAVIVVLLVLVSAGVVACVVIAVLVVMRRNKRRSKEDRIASAIYESPPIDGDYQTQPEKHSATGSLDAQYNSLKALDVPQLYTQLNTATKPEKTTHSATDPLDAQYSSLKAPDVPQLYTQLDTATNPSEHTYSTSGDLVEEAYVPIFDESHSNLNVATPGSRKAESSYRVGEHQYASVQSTQTGADQQTVSVKNKHLDKRNIPIPSEVYEEVGIPNDHDMESTADSEYI